jgi:hypothetical protein
MQPPHYPEHEPELSIETAGSRPHVLSNTHFSITTSASAKRVQTQFLEDVDADSVLPGVRAGYGFGGKNRMCGSHTRGHFEVARYSSDEPSVIGAFRPKARGTFLQSTNRSSNISGVIKVPKVRFFLALSVPSLIWLAVSSALVAKLAGQFHGGSVAGFLGAFIGASGLVTGMVYASTSAVRENVKALLIWLQELALKAGVESKYQ